MFVPSKGFNMWNSMCQRTHYLQFPPGYLTLCECLTLIPSYCTWSVWSCRFRIHSQRVTALTHSSFVLWMLQCSEYILPSADRWMEADESAPSSYCSMTYYTWKKPAAVQHPFHFCFKIAYNTCSQLCDKMICLWFKLDNLKFGNYLLQALVQCQRLVI